MATPSHHAELENFPMQQAARARISRLPVLKDTMIKPSATQLYVFAAAEASASISASALASASAPTTHAKIGHVAEAAVARVRLIGAVLRQLKLAIKTSRAIAPDTSQTLPSTTVQANRENQPTSKRTTLRPYPSSSRKQAPLQHPSTHPWNAFHQPCAMDRSDELPDHGLFEVQLK